VHHRITRTYCVLYREVRVEEIELIGCSETTRPLCGVTILSTNPTMNCRENISLPMRTALFWVITQRVAIISYRRFGTTLRRALFSSTSWRKPEIKLYLLSSIQRILLTLLHVYENVRKYYSGMRCHFYSVVSATAGLTQTVCLTWELIFFLHILFWSNLCCLENSVSCTCSTAKNI
jgi:hypothetical protein